MFIVYLVVFAILLVIGLVIFKWRGSVKGRARETRFHHVGPGEPRANEPPRGPGIN